MTCLGLRFRYIVGYTLVTVIVMGSTMAILSDLYA